MVLHSRDDTKDGLELVEGGDQAPRREIKRSIEDPRR